MVIPMATKQERSTETELYIAFEALKLSSKTTLTMKTVAALKNVQIILM